MMAETYKGKLLQISVLKHLSMKHKKIKGQKERYMRNIKEREKINKQRNPKKKQGSKNKYKLHTELETPDKFKLL